MEEFKNINLEELAPPPRKTMTLFWIVDTSGSMSGQKIQAVEVALENIKSALADISKKNDDAEIKIALLTFDDKSSWITPVPMSPETISTKFQLGCSTMMGSAYKALEKKLSRNEFMKSVTSQVKPVMILLTDGCPTDNTDAGLKELRANNWFTSAMRFGVAIGDDADENEIAKFTGSKETVFKVINPAILTSLLTNLSTISSKFASKNGTREVNSADDPLKQAQSVVQNTKEAVKEDIAQVTQNSSSSVADELKKELSGW